MNGLGGWERHEEMADINIVPLVDVLLVLLVIFMITAPIITHSLDVQLPKASLAPGARPNQTMIVSLDRNGRLAMNGDEIGHFTQASTQSRFDAAILKWKRRYPGAPAFLRADHRILYGSVIGVMAQMRRLGVVDVGLMIEREGH